jgi:hypothetical protein
MELELIVGLLTGPAAGVGVSIYFLNRFMNFQKDVTDRLIDEIKKDRLVHEQIVSRMDTRLSNIESVIETFVRRAND